MVFHRTGPGGAEGPVYNSFDVDWGNEDRAFVYYEKKVMYGYGSVQELHELACFLLTCSEPLCRDGRLSAQLAGVACDLTGRKAPDYLATLAAAFAASGDFEAAVETQLEADQADLEG